MKGVELAKLKLHNTSNYPPQWVRMVDAIVTKYWQTTQVLINKTESFLRLITSLDRLNDNKIMLLLGSQVSYLGLMYLLYSLLQ